MKCTSRIGIILLMVFIFSWNGCRTSGLAGGQGHSRTAEPPVTQESVLPGYSGPSYLYEQFNAFRIDGPILAGLRQTLVPQGMAYWEDQDLMIISNYRSDSKTGVLVCIRMGDGTLDKVIHLMDSENIPHTDHLGGLAVSDKHLWIASGLGVYAIPLEIIADLESGTWFVLAEKITTETRGSFAAFDNGVLWVGEFARIDGSYSVSESHHRPTRDGRTNRAWMGGYRLQKGTDLPDFARIVNGRLQPDLVLSIPDEIQGAAFLQDRILLSASYGRGNDSRLLIHSVSFDEPPQESISTGVPGQSDISLWYIDRLNKLNEIRVPPMSEAVTLYKDFVAVLFESGAELYRDTAKYPIDRIQLLPQKLFAPESRDP